MADKYVELNVTTGRLQQKEATTVSTGASQAGKIPALDSAGKLDVSLIPSGVGGDQDVHSITATEAIDAGSWVNVYNNGGSRAIRKALATDATKPANGYIVASVGAGQATNISPPAELSLGSAASGGLPVLATSN